MTKKQAIQLFEERKVRTIWDDEHEKWYFSIVDVCGVLTDSKDPSGYVKTMKRRDPMLAKGWGQIVTPLSVQTPGGRQKVNCANIKDIFRIIQAIPSPKAEPLKRNQLESKLGSPVISKEKASDYLLSNNED